MTAAGTYEFFVPALETYTLDVTRYPWPASSMVPSSDSFEITVGDDGADFHLPR